MTHSYRVLYTYVVVLNEHTLLCNWHAINIKWVEMIDQTFVQVGYPNVVSS